MATAVTRPCSWDLGGEHPETVDTDLVDGRVSAIREQRRPRLLDEHEIDFCQPDDLVLRGRHALAFHPNGMRFPAAGPEGTWLAVRTYHSIGGGFVVAEGAGQTGGATVPSPFTTAAERLAHTRTTGLPISGVVLANERT